MANYSDLKSSIQSVIRQNGSNAITGQLLQNSLLSMIESLGANQQFAGIASPTTNPGTPDQNVFYIAATAGTYANFGGAVLNAGDVAIFTNKSGSWAKINVPFLSNSLLGVMPAIAIGNTSGVIPDFNTKEGYLDMGGDTVVFTQNKYYLMNLAQEYRKIPFEYKNTTLYAIIYDTIAKTIEFWHYTQTRPSNVILLGTVRYDANLRFITANCFFPFTVDGKPWIDGQRIFLSDRIANISGPGTGGGSPFNLDLDTNMLTSVGRFLVNFPGTSMVVTVSQSRDLSQAENNVSSWLLFDSKDNSFSVQTAGTEYTDTQYIVGEFYFVDGRVTEWNFNFTCTVNRDRITLNEGDLINTAADRVKTRLCLDVTNVLRIFYSMKTGYQIAITAKTGEVGEIANTATNPFDSGWLTNSGNRWFKKSANTQIFNLVFRKTDNSAITPAEIIQAIDYIGVEYGDSEFNDSLRATEAYKNRGILFLPQGMNTINIDLQNRLIDFGEDPLLVIYGQSYALKSLDPSGDYRKVSIAGFGTGALLVVFSILTNKFTVIPYTTRIPQYSYLVGTIRFQSSGIFSGANFGGIPYSVNNSVPNNYPLVNVDRGIKIIAHRGLHNNNVPENSIDSAKYAGIYGYDMAETDFCPTSDGVLVLMHDASINRTMRTKDGYATIPNTVNVADVTYNELKNNYVLLSGDPRFRRPIPTLEEYFIACRTHGVMPLPEIKSSGMSEAYIKQAFDMGCELVGEGNFAFCSFSYAYLDYVRTLSDKTPLYYIGSSILNTVSTKDSTSRNNPLNIWYPSSGDVTEALVKQYRKAGMRVATWTINYNQVDKFIKWGCDVATDNIAPNIKLTTAYSAGSLVLPLNYGYSSNCRFEYNSIIMPANATMYVTVKSLDGCNFLYMRLVSKGSLELVSGSYNFGQFISDDFEEFYVQAHVSAKDIYNVVITAKEQTTIQFLDTKIVVG